RLSILRKIEICRIFYFNPRRVSLYNDVVTRAVLRAFSTSGKFRTIGVSRTSVPWSRAMLFRRRLAARSLVVLGFGALCVWSVAGESRPGAAEPVSGLIRFDVPGGET